jgi:hypothetical protein
MVDAVGSFDAAVVTKDADGKVQVAKDETATQTGGASFKDIEKEIKAQNA